MINPKVQTIIDNKARLIVQDIDSKFLRKNQIAVVKQHLVQMVQLLEQTPEAQPPQPKE